MERIANILNMLDYTLGTKKKRHIAGGMLLSISLLFAGLTFTVLTIRSDNEMEDDDEQYIELE